MGYILENYKDSYTHAVDRLTREELLLDVFHEMDVNSLGRAMSYLTLIYRVSHMIKEDTVTSSCSFSCTRDKKIQEESKGVLYANFVHGVVRLC